MMINVWLLDGWTIIWPKNPSVAWTDLWKIGSRVSGRYISFISRASIDRYPLKNSNLLLNPTFRPRFWPNKSKSHGLEPNKQTAHHFNPQFLERRTQKTPCRHLCWWNWDWLVVYLPLWKILVNGKDYPIYEMENKKCLKPTTRR
jgi:hypothetical protein